MYKLIFLNNIALTFNKQTCFEDFSVQIMPKDRIAIIGANGTGKSSLLKIINGDLMPSSGNVEKNKNIIFGYVPQLIYDYTTLSGAEKFNKTLSLNIAKKPDILLLDEPTNHLDLQNRKSLMKMLSFYREALVIASHDKELFKNINIFWHISNKKITIFNGHYSDYCDFILNNHKSVKDELKMISKERKEVHRSLMREQERTKKSKEIGEKFVLQKRWLSSVGNFKASCAEKTLGKKLAGNIEKRESLYARIENLKVVEPLKPSFTLNSKYIGLKTVISISCGVVGYKNKQILKDINLFARGNEHVAIVGENGSGKTTLLKAILNTSDITKEGTWNVPSSEDIGYLDQYYSFLDTTKTVLETIADLAQGKTLSELRLFLNNFLFRKNEDVNKYVKILSCGEMARLSLAKIAIKTPKLLLLDEITNNIDLETREHIVEVLKVYPGAMIVVSHDASFLEEINISNKYQVKKYASF